MPTNYFIDKIDRDMATSNYERLLYDLVTLLKSGAGVGGGNGSGTAAGTINVMHCGNPTTNAYKNQSGIANFAIPDGTTEIGANAFDGCTGALRIYIPVSVTTIGASAFNGFGSSNTSAHLYLYYGGTAAQYATLKASANVGSGNAFITANGQDDTGLYSGGVVTLTCDATLADFYAACASA